MYSYFIVIISKNSNEALHQVMNADQYSQLSPQNTLTRQHINETEWLNTKKQGVDNDQIGRDWRKYSLLRRRRRRDRRIHIFVKLQQNLMGVPWSVRIHHKLTF